MGPHRRGVVSVAMPDLERFSPADLQAQRPFLRTLAVGLLLDEHHAEDAVQETMVQTILHGPRDEGGLGPWMRTVCRNLALNLRRGDRRRLSRERAAVDEATTRGITPRSDLTEDLRGWVVDAVVGLPEPYRDAILRRYYENQPPRAIAKTLGVPVTTIYSRLQKGLQRLREDLEGKSREAGVDRTAMRGALCAIAGWPAGGAAAPLISGWVAGLAAAGVLAIGLGWLWFVGGGNAPTGPAVSTAAATATRKAPDTGVTPASTNAVRLADRTPADPAARPGLAVHGRALDERRRPLAGARVELHRLDGTEVITATSDTAGHFSLTAPLATANLAECGLVVRHTQRVAVRQIPVPWITTPRLGTDRIDLGAVVLEPGALAVVHVHSRHATATTQPTRVRARLRKHQPRGRLRSSNDELFDGYFLGRFEMSAATGRRLTLPAMPPGELEVEVEVETTGGGRLAGCAATQLESGTATLHVELDSAPKRSGVQSNANGREVRFAWRLPVGLALDTPIAVHRSRDGRLDQPGRGEARDGRLVVVDLGDHTASAVGTRPPRYLGLLPDGRRLHLPTDGTAELPMAQISGSRAVRVQLRDGDGTPVADMPVTAIERGATAALHAVARTDAAGIATFEGLHFGRIELSIVTPDLGGRVRRQPLGVITAGRDDGNLDWRFGQSRDVELTLLIDGEPRLPHAFEIIVRDGLTGPWTADPATATVRLPVWANRNQTVVPLAILAAGCQRDAVRVPFSAANRSAGNRPAEAPFRHRFALKSLGAVRIEITPPIDGLYDVGLETMPPGDSRWWRVRGTEFRSVGTHRLQLQGIAPGCYRLRELRSGRVSAPFDVDAATGFIDFDLSGVTQVTGTIHLPPDVEAAELRLTPVTGRPPASLRFDSETGEFALRVDAAHPTRLIARHPRCAPLTFEVAANRTIAPQLVRLPDVRFRLAAAAGTPLLRIRTGERHDPIMDELVTAAPDGTYSFSAPAGPHAVRIDVPGHLPLTFSPLVVADGADLGTLTPAPGTTLPVTLRLRSDMLAPQLVVQVFDATGDRVQELRVDGESEFVVSGLAPGQHELRVTNAPGETTRVRWQRQVDVQPGMPTVKFDLTRRAQR